jgi:hypothetical protein
MAMKTQHSPQIDWDKFFGRRNSPPSDEEDFGDAAQRVKRWLGFADRMFAANSKEEEPTAD